MKLYKITDENETVWIIADTDAEAMELARETYFEDCEEELMLGVIPDDQIVAISYVGESIDLDGVQQDKVVKQAAKQWCKGIQKPTILGSTLY